jgi:hypothetical protein
MPHVIIVLCKVTYKGKIIFVLRTTNICNTILLCPNYVCKGYETHFTYMISEKKNRHTLIGIYLTISRSEFSFKGVYFTLFDKIDKITWSQISGHK